MNGTTKSCKKNIVDAERPPTLSSLIGARLKGVAVLSVALSLAVFVFVPKAEASVIGSQGSFPQETVQLVSGFTPIFASTTATVNFVQWVVKPINNTLSHQFTLYEPDQVTPLDCSSSVTTLSALGAQNGATTTVTEVMFGTECGVTVGQEIPASTSDGASNPNGADANLSTSWALYDAGNEGGSAILNTISPLANMATPSTQVVFEFTYWNADDFDTAGAEIVNITQQQNIAPLTEDILVSGQGSFQQTLGLNSGMSYMWRPYLYNSSSTEKLFGEWEVPFGVVTTTGTTTAFATSISSTTPSFSDYVNVPELLKTKVPFAYLYQFVTMLQDTSSIPSATSTSLTLSFISQNASTTVPASFYNSLTNVEMFSTSTVTDLMPQNVIDLLYALQVAVIWLSVAFTCYHVGMRATNHQT